MYCPSRAARNQEMKTTFITLIALAFTASAQLVKLEGAKAVQYKEASGAKLFLHVFNPEGHKTTDAAGYCIFLWWRLEWRHAEAV